MCWKISRFLLQNLKNSAGIQNTHPHLIDYLSADFSFFPQTFMDNVWVGLICSVSFQHMKFSKLLRLNVQKMMGKMGLNSQIIQKLCEKQFNWEENLWKKSLEFHVNHLSLLTSRFWSSFFVKNESHKCWRAAKTQRLFIFMWVEKISFEGLCHFEESGN